MARDYSKERKEVLEYLKGTGEIPYEDLLDHFQSQGKFDHVNQLPALYQRRETAQRLVKQPDGALILMVKVAGE